MTPIDWATRPLKRYANFSGRAPRAEYWWYMLLLVVLAIVAMIGDSLIGMSLFGPYGPLYALVLFGTLIPSLAVAVRRLHDTNRSGWWLLLPAIPYVVLGFQMGRTMADPTDMSAMATVGLLGIAALVCGLAFLVLMVLRGTPGPNRFGEDPHGATAMPAHA